jgi:GTP1/Obg family GTP-binding protein
MKNSIQLLFAVLFCFSTVDAQQKESYKSLMMDYFKVSGIDAEYEGAYDGMVKMVQDAYQTQEVPATTWQKIYDGKNASVAKFKGILASEYRSIFEDKQDIRNLIKFYASSTGVQYKKDRAGLNESQLAELEKFKISDTGMKLFGRIQEINKVKESSSIYWSRELICSVTTQLKEKGFQSSMHMPSCN